MARFRKKPVVINAVQLTWSNWNEVCDFIPKPWFVRGCWLDHNGKELSPTEYRFEQANEEPNSALGLLINTLEGNSFLARGNDWIIKGIKGEFYACKPDIFEATYEAVSPGPTEQQERKEAP